MNIFEWLLWYLTGSVPKRYGHRVRMGYYYDTYHDKGTGKYWLLEKKTGRMLERD